MARTFQRMEIPGSVPGASKFNTWIADVIKGLEDALNPSCQGINVTSGPMGLSLKVVGIEIALILTTSTFTARSGATPGFGTATIQLFNGTTFFADTAYPSMTMYNYSSSATPPASGKYGVAVKLWGSYWFLVAVEC